MWLYADIVTLADIPRHYARKQPTKTALIDPLGTRTFAELDRASNRLANLILACGIEPGSQIGFLGKNSARYFELLFGTVKAGCTFIPLNWRLSEAELQLVIDDARCPLIFVDQEFAASFANVRARCAHSVRCIHFDSASSEPCEIDRLLLQASDVDPKVPIDSAATAMVLYTSGTTGKPKGVMLSHRGLNHMRLCEHLEPALRWHADDVTLMAMPNFHLVGTGLSLQALYNGTTVSTLPVLDAAKTLQTIQRDRPTVCTLVPTAIQMLLDHPDAAHTDFSSLRLVMYAGSPINVVLLRRALEAFKCSFMQFYGATESTGALTLLRPEQHDLQNESQLKSCGTPLPLIDIKIVDSEGVEVPDGVTGEFFARTPAIFEGYCNQPAATAEVLREGWYRTGDAGFRDATSGLLFIVDRVKDMIITGGENVYSGEVEQALYKHPGVSLVTVIGTPHARWGEQVTAIVVRTPGSTFTADELLAHCRNLLATYKVPKVVHFASSLPMTTTGKILKRAVREQYTRAQQ